MTQLTAISGCLAWLPLAGLLAGCASVPPDDDETRPTIAEILTEPATDVPPRRCLSLHAYERVEVLDRQRVLFSGTRDRYWLNELPTPCAGLRRNQTLVFTLRTSQICDLDTFDAVYDPWWGRSSVRARCALGKFHPITNQQVVLIRQALGIKPHRTADEGFEVNVPSGEKPES